MTTPLYPYYERELVFIRALAQDFAKQYPGTASRLLLEANRSVDPHVERLIEGFALLAGRIHHKIDDEFPELTDALFSVLYPHYLAPIPSMGIVQFDVDPQRVQLKDGFLIDRHARLRTPAVHGLRCLYRTGYPVRLWPILLTEAKLLPPPFPNSMQPPAGSRAVLRFVMEIRGGLPLTALSLDRLRFYLANDSHVVANLYESLLNNALQVVFRPLDVDPAKGPKATLPPPVVLAPGSAIHPVGFNPGEEMLPYPPQSLPGYRLLSEFFAFPNKFHFIDLGGFEQARRAGFHKKFEVLVFLNRTQTTLEQAIDTTTFRLGCTPIVNLFEQTAEPINLSQTKSRYRVTPDVAYPRGMEVYSIESVMSVDPITGRTTDYQPFYSFRHGGDRATQRTFWYAERRPAFGGGDRGTEVHLNLVDLDFDPCVPAESAVIVRTLCTNRDLPVQLQQAGENLPLVLEKAAPINATRCLRTPTSPLRPPLRRGAYWRLISHLSLNHLSLVSPPSGGGTVPEGLAALQEILRLYDFSDPEATQQLAAVNQQLIEGVTSLSSRPVVGRMGGPISGGFCRGVEVTLEFDEEKYIGTGMYLFASVLERFLGLYVSVNSFSQLIAKTRQGQAVLKHWPPRAGEQVLL